MAVGQFATLSRRFGPAEVAAFAELSGDDNPVHLDAKYAATTRFGKPIVHGMLYGSMIGTLFGATIEGSIYVSQNFKFRKPIFVGEEVTARVDVLRIQTKPHFVHCRTTISNEEGAVCMDGEAVVMLPGTPKLDAER